MYSTTIYDNVKYKFGKNSFKDLKNLVEDVATGLDLSPNDLDVLRFIIDRTLRFRKFSEEIPLRHFTTGIYNKDGRCIIKPVKLSPSTIKTCIKRLLSTGLISITKIQIPVRKYGSTVVNKFTVNGYQIINSVIYNELSVGNKKVENKLRKYTKIKYLRKSLGTGQNLTALNHIMFINRFHLNNNFVIIYLNSMALEEGRVFDNGYYLTPLLIEMFDHFHRIVYKILKLLAGLDPSMKCKKPRKSTKDKEWEEYDMNPCLSSRIEEIKEKTNQALDKRKERQRQRKKPKQSENSMHVLHEWNSACSEVFGSHWIRLNPTPKNLGMIKNSIIKQLNLSGDYEYSKMIRWIAENWNAINERLFYKMNNVPPEPSIEWVCKFASKYAYAYQNKGGYQRLSASELENKDIRRLMEMGYAYPQAVDMLKNFEKIKSMQKDKLKTDIRLKHEVEAKKQEIRRLEKSIAKNINDSKGLEQTLQETVKELMETKRELRKLKK